MSQLDALRRLFDEILEEARSNARFRDRLTRALGQESASRSDPDAHRAHRAGRRAPGVLNPLTVLREGESALRARLAALTLDQLRDIVAEHGMDSSRLAMKWKDPQRVADLIVESAKQRSSKGDAFRAAPDAPRASSRVQGGKPPPSTPPGPGGDREDAPT
jgi:hypothetical protein